MLPGTVIFSFGSQVLVQWKGKGHRDGVGPRNVALLHEAKDLEPAMGRVPTIGRPKVFMEPDQRGSITG